MTLQMDFRNGSGVTMGARAGRRRRAIAIALTVCSAMTVAQHADAAPPSSRATHPVGGTAEAAYEGGYATGHRLPTRSPAVLGGHATHDPLWAGYGAVPHGGPVPHAHASCDCAAGGNQRPSAIRRAFGSVTSRIDRLIFGCGCDGAPAGGDVPCDAIGPDQFVPMPAHRRAVGTPTPGRIQLSPMPYGTPGPVPVPRRESIPPASDPQSDPFADDQASAGAKAAVERTANPAVERTGYYD